MIGGGAEGCKVPEAMGVTTIGEDADGRGVAATVVSGELRRLAITRNPSTASKAPPTVSTIKRCFRGNEESSGRTERRVRVTGASVPSSTGRSS